MNTKIRSLKKVSSCGPQRNFGYNFRRIWPVYQNEFDMPELKDIVAEYRIIEPKKTFLGVFAKAM